MTRLDFPETGQQVMIPSSWSEMTPEQVQAVFRIHDEAARKGHTVLERNIRILFFYPCDKVVVIITLVSDHPLEDIVTDDLEGPILNIAANTDIDIGLGLDGGSLGAAC